MEALERKGWKLSHIINTHHHHDHAGGNLELKKRTGCTILGESVAEPTSIHSRSFSVSLACDAGRFVS
jgi:glyoxylase-like metal-dependent hydrolase (beta-lactamase superfamily II)